MMSIEQRKEKDRLKAMKYRESHPDYNKNYYNKIKPIFNEKYKETIKNNYIKNKDKIKGQYLMKKDFMELCKIDF
jgi:hypothetical protein